MPILLQLLEQDAVVSKPSLNILNLPVKIKNKTTSTARAIAAIIIVLIEMLWDFFEGIIIR
ncbi:hypothetical protein HYX03_01450 [Candidatus Woesearchaeota archaeon]|nr:hypothetical protein [Candidatus Woesearchaeota archaeon]